jgi:hypothetical protein
MRHLVVYRASDGRQCYHETEELDGAVRAVEELRNTQNVSDLGIFSLHPVPIEFRPYYRVEVVPGEVPPPPPVDAAPWPEVTQTAEIAEPVVEPVVESVVEPVPPYEQPHEVPAASTRFGLFSRG